MQFLHTDGKFMRNEEGEKVFLRGVCIGSWLNMESFMTGHLGTESRIRKTMEQELGKERAEAFFKGFEDNFITEGDFEYLASIGVNVARIALNYRHLEDDDNPFAYLEDGFYYLDKAVEWGRKYGIYIILDLHALPGWQNCRWHCDNHHGAALLWESKFYQERSVKLWGHIASHYKDEPVVAGYDLMNEPEAPNTLILRDVYDAMIREIRSTGARQVVFLEGNDRGEDFSNLSELIGENVAFSSHNYNSVTLDARNYPGIVGEHYADRDYMEKLFLERNQWLLEQGVVSYCGEFSPIFFESVDQPSYAELARLKALDDQIDIFNGYDQHWTIWSYKDIHYVGLVVPKSDCEYMRRVAPVVEIKRRLSLDCFTSRRYGGVFKYSQQLLEEVGTTVGDVMNNYSLPYASLIKRIGEEAISSSLSCFMSPLFAGVFALLVTEEIADMMEKAFNIRYMDKRTCLEKVLRKNLKENIGGR